MPRTPKAERAPKPREEICRSCVILTILHRDAGHGGQRFGRVNLALVGADSGRVDDVDRSRQVKRIVFDPAAADDDGIKGHGSGAGGAGDTGERGGEDHGEARRCMSHDFSILKVRIFQF
jgi:hypothetical protein